MHLVTGGAGFIGSSLVQRLNERGLEDIVVVDNLASNNKFRNLADLRIADYLDKSELDRALDGALGKSISRIYHLGACTDTLEQDGRAVIANNFTSSKRLLHFALERALPLVYSSSAAVYGSGEEFTPKPENEQPLNVYALSKLLLDRYVQRLIPKANSTLVGLRYFNVYGARELHKGRMASMVFHIHQQLSENGRVRLFEGTEDYGDGEQRRDFVFVQDVVDVNLHFGESPQVRKGIFNVGTGKSVSFNELAALVRDELGGGNIEYVPCPASIREAYQSFTEADISGLRRAGYDAPFTDLTEGVQRAIAAWSKDSKLPDAQHART